MPGSAKFDSCPNLLARPGDFGYFFLVRVWKEALNFPIDRTYGFRPDADKLNPNPYTRKAIANFVTSLYFNIRARQAKSEIYDGAFREMCRTVYEHSMHADVGRMK